MVARSPAWYVREFHQHFGLALDETLGSDLRVLRAELIREEADESIQALHLLNLRDIAKELADLVYVAYGAAISFGIDLDIALRAVHKSNMSKLGPDGRPVYRADGKVLKGPNYQEPDMTFALPD